MYNNVIQYAAVTVTIYIEGQIMMYFNNPFFFYFNIHIKMYVELK